MTGLAKRLVACKGFRWMPGMLTVTGYRLVRPQHGMWRITQHAPENHLDCVDVADHNFVPDLTDPATLGAVESLLPPQWYVVGSPDGWRIDCYLVPSGVSSTTVGDLHSYETRADLLIAALEAAEGQEALNE